MCSFNEDDKERPQDKDDQTLDTVVVTLFSSPSASKAKFCIASLIL